MNRRENKMVIRSSIITTSFTYMLKAFLVLLLTTLPSLIYANAQDQFDIFAASDETNKLQVPYERYDEFMSLLSVESKDRVDLRYRAMKPEGIEFLDAYINVLSKVTVTSLSSNEQLAYWLNMHNMLVVKAIASQKRFRSLKKQRGNIDSPGPMWTEKRITVQGVPLSIDDIERNIIIRLWQSPDVIYGLYQGVLGGPPISKKAFRAETLANELHLIALKYLEAPSVLRVRRRKLTLPVIFDWYKKSLFENSDAKLIAHLKTKSVDEISSQLDSVSSISYSKMDYTIEAQTLRARARSFDDENNIDIFGIDEIQEDSSGS